VRNPRFSVVIAAFNAAGTIASAVGSALSQTQRDIEVVVVDDGSSDGTASIVAAINDPRVRLVSQVNRGLAAARNAGVAVACGSYVAILDSDDLLLPRYLELVGRALDEAGRPGFAYTDAYAFDASSGLVRQRTAMALMRPPRPPPSDPDRFLLELLKRNFVYVSIGLPRGVLDAVGGYDESRFAAEDYELCLRILAAGYDPIWIPGQHALYRIHPGQMSADGPRMTREVLGMFEALRPETMPSDLHRELLARRRREAERELRVVQGDARLAWALRRTRHAIGRVRQRTGLGDSWYHTPPADVAAAFPDLSAV